MRRYAGIISDINSVVLAAAILYFYLYRPGYTPMGDNAVLMGVGVVVALMILYLFLEGMVVLRDATVSSFYFAVETFMSYLPAMAIVWVMAAWYYGIIVISQFQWVAGGIIVAFLLIDLLGFTAALAQRLLLTDEMRTQK